MVARRAHYSIAHKCILVAKKMGAIPIYNFEKEKIWSAQK